MSKASEALSQYYFEFTNQQKDWDFFLGLAAYMQVVAETDELKEVIAVIRGARSTFVDQINEQEGKAVEELRHVKDTILKRIKDENLSFELLELQLKDLDDRESGKIDPDAYQSNRLETGLRNVMTALQVKKCMHILKGIVADDITYNDLKYGSLKLSEAFDTRMAMSYGFSQSAGSELWGILRKLEAVPRVIFKSDKVLANMKGKGIDTKDFEQLVKEMDIIRNEGVEFSFLRSYGAPPPPFSSSTDNRIGEFSRNTYKAHAVQVHGHFIRELSKRETEAPATNYASELNSKMEFDSLNGVLKCGKLDHHFHRGEKGEERRLVFFRELWDERRFFKKGKELLKGTLRTPEYLAVRLKLASEPHAFRLNKRKIQNQLFGMIKGVNGILKRKGSLHT